MATPNIKNMKEGRVTQAEKLRNQVNKDGSRVAICICGSTRYSTRRRATVSDHYDSTHRVYATSTLDSHPLKKGMSPTYLCTECGRDMTARVRTAKEGKPWTRRPTRSSAGRIVK